MIRFRTFLCVGGVTTVFAIMRANMVGTDAFFNEILHSAFTPTQLLILVALGGGLAQQGFKESVAALRVFVVALAVGCVAEYYFFFEDVGLLILSVAAMTGVLVALNSLIGAPWCSALAAFSGFLIGVDSTQSFLIWHANWTALVVSGVGACILLLCLVALVSYFTNKAWQKVGIRVIGSWVAASSLMMLAMSFSTRI